MNPWEILEIERTEKVSDIKKAYSRQLKKHHPEEDPEGFMLVRQAYELALNLAKTTISEVTVDPQSISSVSSIPSEIETKEMIAVKLMELTVFEKMSQLYGDLQKRIQVMSWKMQITSLSLHEYNEFVETVCDFFNVHHVLPFEVWKYLEEEFHLTQLKGFIWLESIQSDDGLSYKCFDFNIQKDYSAYIEKRLLAYQQFVNYEYSSSLETAELASNVYNLDGFIFHIQGLSYYMLRDYPNAILLFDKAIALDSKNVNLRLVKAYALLRSGGYDQAKREFEEILVIVPNHYEAQVGLIDYYRLLNNWDVAHRNNEKLNVHNDENLFHYAYLIASQNRINRQKNRSKSSRPGLTIVFSIFVVFTILYYFEDIYYCITFLVLDMIILFLIVRSLNNDHRKRKKDLAAISRDHVVTHNNP